MTTNVLSFAITPHVRWSNKPWSIIPRIDGLLLTELITEFERNQGFDEPIGGYGGLLPEYFACGPLERYFMADFEPGDYFEEYGIYFLGCHCGEAGCWPLVGQIVVESDSVIWRNFKQPHRRNRDYSAFGSFLFDIHQYKQELVRLSTEFSALTTSNKR